MDGVPLTLAQQFEAFKVDAISVGKDHVFPDLVADCRRRGIQLWVWTVNSVHFMERLLVRGSVSYRSGGRSWTAAGLSSLYRVTYPWCMVHCGNAPRLEHHRKIRCSLSWAVSSACMMVAFSTLRMLFPPGSDAMCAARCTPSPPAQSVRDAACCGDDVTFPSLGHFLDHGAEAGRGWPVFGLPRARA